MSDCDHEHAGPNGLRGHGLEHALADADARCARTGQRMTQPRRRALEMLLEAGKPIKAYDLIADFAGEGKPAKPPTVYRALEFLSKQGLAHRIESLNAYVACGAGDKNHAAAFLICDCCGASAEIEPFAPERVQAAADKAGYQIDQVVVEAHGRCSACA